MIRRLYVDNYRTLVDFTWEPGPEVLILGANGSGKTAVLDALDIVRDWVWNWSKAEDNFDRDALTKWSDSGSVRFELDLETEGSVFFYQVEFDCNSRDRNPTVTTEYLRRDNAVVIERQLERVTFYDEEANRQGDFLIPVNQSAVAGVFAGPGQQRVGPFLTALNQMVVVRPLPGNFEGEARKPAIRMDHWFENFTAWYWNQATNGRFPVELPKLLSSVWPDFEFIKLNQAGTVMELKAVFTSETKAKSIELNLNELSDGERMLLALYSLAAYQRATDSTTIIIDEPDNFVAMAELQPWLLQMLDDRPDGGQIVLVSHNAEIANTMGEERVEIFERTGHLSPTRVRKLLPDDSQMPISERITRGWLGTEERPA